MRKRLAGERQHAARASICRRCGDCARLVLWLEGLRAGLNEQNLEEGKHFALRARDTGGDLKAVEEAAQTFEREKVALIFTAATSVTLAAKRATARTLEADDQPHRSGQCRVVGEGHEAWLGVAANLPP